MLDLEDYGANEEEYEKILKTKKTCKDICNWFLNEKGSIRMCAKNLCLSKSLVHVYIYILTSKLIILKNINKLCVF